MALDLRVHLAAQRCPGVEAGSGPDEVGDGRIGVEAVQRRGSEEYGGAECGGVIGDGTVVPDDHVGREQRLTPVLQRVDQRQAGPPGPVQPGPDLAGTVTVPDVRVEDCGDAVLVGGRLRREPREQCGQRVVTAPASVTGSFSVAVAQQRPRAPGGVEQDETLSTPHAERPAEPVPVRTCCQHPVEAGVADEDGGGQRLRTGGGQPVELLGVGEGECLGEGNTVRQQPVRRESEDGGRHTPGQDRRIRIRTRCSVLGARCSVLGARCSVLGVASLLV
ncbi:hypothetical protein [Streptomyces sp. NPDC054874]